MLIFADFLAISGVFIDYFFGSTSTLGLKVKFIYFFKSAISSMNILSNFKKKKNRQKKTLKNAHFPLEFLGTLKTNGLKLMSTSESPNSDDYLTHFGGFSVRFVESVAAWTLSRQWSMVAIMFRILLFQLVAFVSDSLVRKATLLLECFAVR